MEGMAESGFWSLLLETGPVIKVVFAVLLAMSLASWSLIFLKWHELRKAQAQAREDRSAFEAASRLDQAMTSTRTRPDQGVSRRVAETGMDELRRLADLDLDPAVKGRIILESVRHTLQDEAQAQADRLHGSLALLATVGNVAPLLGLFGTVWGIMNSFSSITGGADIVTGVAPGLAEALSTTALGLIVAIPAVLAYNAFLKRLGDIEGELARLSSAFMNRVKEEFSSILTCAPREN
ncbi:MotA/TolQ/ExbB proton channel family protein [Paucidesulfovibrio longus]|uniref:MotA/TolQ/ExbB proton channel family protein n=1 Tax=Paucidesulfovibrio longus TaxID=889 RepID=UPI0003B704CE|nr:MotA/TolQ/ExbB proton channel family protein [Paucidesulfovibrio longus]